MIASTGSGSSYATACSNALSSYSSASSSWGLRHSSVVNATYTNNGMTWIPVTYYANATTLCDGHARVTSSPAVVLSTTTITTRYTTPTESVQEQSLGWDFPVSSPSCSINPSDCDGIWAAYSTSSSKWAAVNATASANYPQITASPSIPPCVNSSQSSSNEAFSKSFYGCGPCTIFGDEVQLFYFPEPTTVSRDMCATTPSAKLTHYNSGVGTPYTGSGAETWNGQGDPPETVVANNHTFTSGTAYISIKTVWAVDRCSTQIGTRVSDAILALPSSSLLSLRYSQNHFQYFATTGTQTGYPFNFADMNSPVPYSAWNGQARCEFPGAADYKCDVIYENQFNPQLAMPPGIRKLNPDWEGCQMWYGGLYDPPYALKPGTAVAVPTPSFAEASTTNAKPSSTAAATTPAPTALADHTTGESNPTQSAGQNTQSEAQATQGSNQNNGGQSNPGTNSEQSLLPTLAVQAGEILPIRSWEVPYSFDIKNIAKKALSSLFTLILLHICSSPLLKHHSLRRRCMIHLSSLMLLWVPKLPICCILVSPSRVCLSRQSSRGPTSATPSLLPITSSIHNIQSLYSISMFY